MGYTHYRTSVRKIRVEVMADDLTQAKELALEKATNKDFNAGGREISAEYDLKILKIGD